MTYATPLRFHMILVSFLGVENCRRSYAQKNAVKSVPDIHTDRRTEKTETNIPEAWEIISLAHQPARQLTYTIQNCHGWVTLERRFRNIDKYVSYCLHTNLIMIDTPLWKNWPTLEMTQMHGQPRNLRVKYASFTGALTVNACLLDIPVYCMDYVTS